MTVRLQIKPASKILIKGYINIYSYLTTQEKRMVFFKSLYKTKHPDWDESMVFLSREFSKSLTGREKVLDIGCGNGNYIIDENRQKIYFAVGIDNDRKSVSKNISLDKVIIGDVEKLPFKDRQFDAVVSLWVLEHIKNPNNLIHEVYRVLKPQGKFYFVTPNYNFIPLRVFKLAELKPVKNFINKKFFGRLGQDVFKTYYFANTINDLTGLNSGRFKTICLKTNFDPSYTSFNKISFYLTALVNMMCEQLHLSIIHPHITGILQKI